MVHLLLISSKGNGVRYFPYSGYLGLSPVKVEGVVITKLDSDLKTIQAKSITVSVRCYESRLGRLGAIQTNVLVDHTQTLWTKPDGQDYDAVGNGEYPFKISLPSNVGGFSTLSFVEYRTVWRVEAVMNHIPITGVGARQTKYVDLPLLRFDVPPNLPSYQTSLIDVEPKLNRQASKPRGPRISYCINAPKFPIGPTDLVSIPIHVLPIDPGVHVRSATLTVERRLVVNDTATPTSAVPFAPPAITAHSLYPSQTSSSAPVSSSIPIPHFSSSTSSLLSHSAGSSFKDYHDTNSIISSSNTITSTTALLPKAHSSQSSDSLSPRTIVTVVAGAESSGSFTRTANGICSKTITFQWPVVKSGGRWGIGETLQSDMVSVKFFVRVKLIITSPFGTDSLELEEEELYIVSANDAERRLAISKCTEALSAERPRSKSKSPRRSRKERENAPELPIPSPALSKPDTPVSSRPTKARGTPRRPHTSAGPRDKSSFTLSGRKDSAYGRTYESPSLPEPPDSDAPYRRKLRPGTANPEITKSSVLGYMYSPRISTSTGTSSIRSNGFTNSTATSDTSNSSVSYNIRDSANIREWEEELARIEVQSRRSSDLLGFGLKRKIRSIRPALLFGNA